ncbi:conserved hypothetical protein; putative peptidase domain [Frankia alni ACN14a]|uniref:DUF2520 domain-containing protein n=1 Tax=Frankia alni (strain DSM 45986 / CECT 9034 / ACN14a) TaxID=326424 RepID=Q0RRU8_FRAAA|nr:conserved hypothetical protein; putative peptidase domain [Frankia alni ACN14a]
MTSRSTHGRADAAARFPAARIGSVPQVAPVLRAAEVLLVAVPDDAIAPVTAELVAADAVRAEQILVHLSGRHGLGVLGAATATGAVRMALHPIMTLPEAVGDPDTFAGVPFGITADPGAEARARGLVADVGGIPLLIEDDRRDLYHAALVLGGNFLTSLTVAAQQTLAAAGVADPGAALAPLLRASLDNALTGGWPASTGPVRRGDLGTVRAHLRALDTADPAVADVYRALVAFTAGGLERAGLLEASVADRLRAGAAGHTAPGNDGAQSPR